ncbi:hypothetical protein LTR08_001331 [Meristemomyces frigidus]|nr:hypothetical protein LTR08_001331 [Meristemomyces frigidus]
MQELDLLILGAGWSSTFLIPLLRERHLSFAATTRDGRAVAGAQTIKWAFDPGADAVSEKQKNQFSSLPLAKHVLVTFPLVGTGQASAIVRGYEGVFGGKKGDGVRFLLFGSTGIWQVAQKTLWVSRRSPYDVGNARAVAEDELLGLGGCVLNLAGLWGGARDPKTWVDRVATTKEGVRAKKSLHMIHGLDVARAVVAVMGAWQRAGGERWMLTDGFVYDWWSLMAGWADAGNGDKSVMGREPAKQAQWVLELMREERVWALPRGMEVLGRCYFGREFWDVFGLVPLEARI